MRGTTHLYLALASIAIAVVAWCGVGYLLYKISADENTEAALASSLTSTASQRSYATALHATVVSTETDRSTLTTAIPADIPSIVNAITSTGAAAGTNVDIGTASPAGLPSTAPPDLHAVEFVVQAQGSFSQVLQAAELFYQFPMPSKVAEIDLENIPGPGTKGNVWQVTVRLQVLTTAAVSS